MFKHNLTTVLNLQRPDKNGLYPVRIRTTIKRKVTYYPTGFMLRKDQLEKGEIVKHPNKLHLNIELRRRINEIEKSLLESSITGGDIARLKNAVSLKFVDFAEKKIKFWASSQDKSTIRHKKSYLNKIKEFSPTLKLKEVNKDTMSKIEDFCRGKGNIPNTVWSCTKFVKTILNAAVEDGILDRNPARGFKGARYSDPFRDTLTKGELERLEAFADNPLNTDKLLSVASWFLFSCYTGLRYGDMKAFNGFVNDKVLLSTDKTGEVVSIYVTDKIRQAYARIQSGIMSNQKNNDYLKSIAAICNINKKVTFHTARHTFAVQYLERGGKLELLSKILGHTTLKTTMIYAKFSNRMIDEDMKKVWDDKPTRRKGQGTPKTEGGG